MGGGLSEPATGRAAHRLRWLPGQGPHGGWCGARMRHALWCSAVMAGGEREQRARARLAAHGRSPAPLDWGIMECAATREGEAEREVLSSPHMRALVAALRGGVRCGAAGVTVQVETSRWEVDVQ